MVQRVADADVLLVQQRFGAHGVGVEVQQAQHLAAERLRGFCLGYVLLPG